MKIDAVGVTSKDLRKSVEFYTLLGFLFPLFDDSEQHVEAIVKPGETRLMIDTHELVKSLIGAEPQPANHSVFALDCRSANEVNKLVEKVKLAGFTVIKEPWDAFWGQRYAVVVDPDGYMVDLFAAL